MENASFNFAFLVHKEDLHKVVKESSTGCYEFVPNQYDENIAEFVDEIPTVTQYITEPTEYGFDPTQWFLITGSGEDCSDDFARSGVMDGYIEDFDHICVFEMCSWAYEGTIVGTHREGRRKVKYDYGDTLLRTYDDYPIDPAFSLLMDICEASVLDPETGEETPVDPKDVPTLLSQGTSVTTVSGLREEPNLEYFDAISRFPHPGEWHSWCQSGELSIGSLRHKDWLPLK